jgi:hypothetical protein
VRLLEAGSWKLEAPSDSSFALPSAFAAIRALLGADLGFGETSVVGKNYRLQDIQL